MIGGANITDEAAGTSNVLAIFTLTSARACGVSTPVPNAGHTLLEDLLVTPSDFSATH